MQHILGHYSLWHSHGLTAIENKQLVKETARLFISTVLLHTSFPGYHKVTTITTASNSIHVYKLYHDYTASSLVHVYLDQVSWVLQSSLLPVFVCHPMKMFLFFTHAVTECLWLQVSIVQKKHCLSRAIISKMLSQFTTVWAYTIRWYEWFAGGSEIIGVPVLRDFPEGIVFSLPPDNFETVVG